LEGFVSFFHFQPHYYGTLKKVTTGFFNNALWAFNSDNVPRMNFMGTQYPQKVTIVSNKEPDKVKAFKSLKIHSNKAFSCENSGDLYIAPNETNPRGMTSVLKAGAFSLIEGRYYSKFGRNMTTHQLAESTDDYLNGEELRGECMQITLNNSSTDEVRLIAVSVQSEYSLRS
jgi:hypothetical protein